MRQFKSDEQARQERIRRFFYFILALFVIAGFFEAISPDDKSAATYSSPAPKVQAESVAPKPKAAPKPKEENPYEGESCDPSLYYGRACRVACFDDPHCVISSRELPGHPCYCHKKIGVPDSW